MAENDTMELQKLFGDQLRGVRKKLNLTLKEAAELSGKPYQEISNIERGVVNFTVDTIEKLTKAYNLQVTFKFKRRAKKTNS